MLVILVSHFCQFLYLIQTQYNLWYQQRQLLPVPPETKAQYYESVLWVYRSSLTHKLRNVLNNQILIKYEIEWNPCFSWNFRRNICLKLRSIANMNMNDWHLSKLGSTFFIIICLIKSVRNHRLSSNFTYICISIVVKSSLDMGYTYTNHIENKRNPRFRKWTILGDAFPKNG